MKKWIALALVAFGCATVPFAPAGVITIHAQSLPVTKTLAWDPSSDATGYIVTLDGVTIGNPSGTSQTFTISTAGAHTFTVTAVNLWANSPVSTLTVNVVVPGKPANLKVQ